MNAILARLDGKKTHLLSSAMAAVTLLQAAGLIHLDPAKLQAALVLLGAGTASALRDALKKR